MKLSEDEEFRRILNKFLVAILSVCIVTFIFVCVILGMLMMNGGVTK